MAGGDHVILTSRGPSEERADWLVGEGEGGTCGFDWPHADCGVFHTANQSCRELVKSISSASVNN